MKIKKYCTVQTVPQSNRKIVEIDKFDTPNTQIHEHLKCTWERSIKANWIRIQCESNTLIALIRMFFFKCASNKNRLIRIIQFASGIRFRIKLSCGHMHTIAKANYSNKYLLELKKKWLTLSCVNFLLVVHIIIINKWRHMTNFSLYFVILENNTTETCY